MSGFVSLEEVVEAYQRLAARAVERPWYGRDGEGAFGCPLGVLVAARYGEVDLTAASHQIVAAALDLPPGFVRAFSHGFAEGRAYSNIEQTDDLQPWIREGQAVRAALLERGTDIRPLPGMGQA